MDATMYMLVCLEEEAAQVEVFLDHIIRVFMPSVQDSIMNPNFHWLLYMMRVNMSFLFQKLEFKRKFCPYFLNIC